jgi:hypothetical protein
LRPKDARDFTDTRPLSILHDFGQDSGWNIDDSRDAPMLGLNRTGGQVKVAREPRTYGNRDNAMRRAPHRHDEHGSMPVEMVALVPVLVAAIMVIAAGERYIDARGQVNDAAYAAARAASLATNQEAAVQAGTEAARDATAGRGHACTDLTVHIDAGDFQPGGNVTAHVTCVADLSDIAGFGLHGHKSFTYTAIVPLDEHRSVP